jgi:agmatinase
MSEAQQQFGFAYEGIASFCRVPVCFDVEQLEADAAVVGICMDTGTTNRSGARLGPRAIREASMIYSMVYDQQTGFYDIELARHVLSGVKIVDCGDLPTLPTLVTETLDLITQSISDLRARKAVPVVLGGDHSISFPVVRGIAGRDTPLHVIQFDTHLDFMDDILGIRHSHANPMKRISELENVTGLTQIGIRGLLNPLGWAEEAQQSKSRFFTAQDVHQQGVDAVAEHIPRCENLYITIDIDSLDPSVAPGTGTPEPGGLSYLQLRDLLRACAGKGRLAGMDLVEVNPLFDPTGRTAQVAARLILDLLAAAMPG